MSEWLLQKLGIIEPTETLVKVKSWKPSWGPYGPEWPTILVESRGGQRMTLTPCLWFLFKD